MKKLIILGLVLALILCSTGAWARTYYVSDELTVLIRGGMSNQHRIIRMVKTGTPLEMLEEHDEYFLVRTRDGVEGYTLKQYLTTDPPKEMVIARLQKEITALKETLAQAESRRESLSNQVTSLTAKEKELQDVTTRYEALRAKSSGVVELASERDQLLAQNEELTAEVRELREANEQMLFTGVIKWFLAGGGVFFGGWVIGKISRRKKKGYSF